MTPPTVLFVGAGFSAAAGLPDTKSLFASTPPADTERRNALLRRVRERYHAWLAQNPAGYPEAYLAHIRGHLEWAEAVQFMALRLLLEHAEVGQIGRPAIIRHNIDRTTGRTEHEEFWDALFSGRVSRPLTVLTTNYDVLCERGLRNSPRPSRHRPGFNYGFGTEELSGGGFPAHRATDPVVVRGRVPLLKLHGSISWSVVNGTLTRYRDCRPGIRGDAAIVAPGSGDRESFLEPLWQQASEALMRSPRWIFVGYSFPAYDVRTRDLLAQAAAVAMPEVHLFNGSALRLASELGTWLPARTIGLHPRIPLGIPDLRDL